MHFLNPGGNMDTHCHLNICDWCHQIDVMSPRCVPIGYEFETICQSSPWQVLEWRSFQLWILMSIDSVLAWLEQRLGCCFKAGGALHAALLPKDAVTCNF